MQAPGYAGTTQETSRVLTRGKLEFFVFSFHYDAGKLQPVVPLDSAQYPNFRILSPSSDLLAQGTAVPAGSPGQWKVGWVVPRNADLNNVNRRYRLQVVMVDTTMRQFETSFEFDIVESHEPAQSPQLQQLLTFSGETIRVSFQNGVRPDALSVRVCPRGQDDSAIHVANFLPPSVGPNYLREIETENTYLYVTDTPRLSAGEYSAIWSVRDTPVSQMDFEHQIIQVIPPSLMFLVKSIRMVVDKLQKKLGIVYAYTNEDMIEYLNRGIAEVNAVPPFTSFNPNNIPAPMENYIIMSASWWALFAQRILYAETNMNFSGQTVTLEYNPGADLEGLMSALKESLNAGLAKAKLAFSRAKSSVGSVAVRPYTNRPQLVFKQGRGPSTQITALLAEIGIID